MVEGVLGGRSDIADKGGPASGGVIFFGRFKFNKYVRVEQM